MPEGFTGLAKQPATCHILLTRFVSSAICAGSAPLVRLLQTRGPVIRAERQPMSLQQKTMRGVLSWAVLVAAALPLGAQAGLKRSLPRRPSRPPAARPRRAGDDSGRPEDVAGGSGQSDCRVQDWRRGCVAQGARGSRRRQVRCGSGTVSRRRRGSPSNGRPIRAGS